MKKNCYVSVSTDPIKVGKNFDKKIIAYAREILSSGADFLHCDIMDTKFVKNKTFDENIVKAINSNCLIPLDVHLMIENPKKKIKEYSKAGANILTVHFESFNRRKDIIEALKEIRKQKMLAGLSIKPQTGIYEIEEFLDYADVILVMSVEPGESGQKFLEQTKERIVTLAKIRQEKGLIFKIEVDGGITPELSKQIRKLGADMIVSGSYVCNSDDKKSAISSLLD